MVVPLRGSDFMLAEVHIRHRGVLSMKALARVSVWWLSLDGMVENVVKSCLECQQA